MNPRDYIGPEVEQAAAQAFRGRKLQYNAGLITGTGYHGQQLEGVHYGQPYGIRSNPPADHELVYLRTAAGLLVVTTRQDATDYANLGLTEPEDGETIIYNAQGVQVKLDKNGDLIHEPKSGRHVKLGSGATKALALDGDNCNANDTFDTWAAAVEAGVAAGGGSVATPWTPGEPLATVTATATIAKGE